MKELRGSFTALVTPMHDDESIDCDGLRRLIQFQLKNNITGLLPLGTTGETPTLTRVEQDTIIKISAEEIAGKCPLIIGVGSNSTVQTIQNGKRAKELGADILLVVTPYYNKPTDEGIYRHFESIAEACDMPILVYNVGGRTGKNINLATMKRLAEIPHVIGVKEASGDIHQMGDFIRYIKMPLQEKGKYFSVLSGDDSFIFSLCALGGDGVISVVSNLIPDRVVKLTKYALEGNFPEARRLHFELLPLFKGVFIETNPIPIKKAMEWAGLISGTLRLPLTPLLQENEKVLCEILQETKVSLKKEKYLV